MINAYPLQFFAGAEPFANIDVTSYEYSRSRSISGSAAPCSA